MLRLALAFCLLSVALGNMDYCSPAVCQTGTHIACDHDGSWSEDCPVSNNPSPFMVNMNADLRSQIITMHNTKRNEIALGEMSRYRPAERMATVRWSPDLATLAEYNVKQCKLAEDPCHSTSKFKYSGQNLRLIQYSGLRTSRTNSELISTVINGWWNQHQHANQIVINSYPASWGGNKMSDFTTMVQEYTWAVGCAIARYQSPDGTNNFLMNCYYAHMNRVNKPVYKRGTTASGCKTGKNVNYPGLCKVAEVYDLSV